jgi:hypothetical protein
MKKVILFSLVFLFAIFSWSLSPITKQARAITTISLDSPSDSIKMTLSKPVFSWITNQDQRERIKKYHIVVDTVFNKDFNLISPVWQDSTIPGTSNNVVYNGPPFVRWKTYYWSVRVNVDSVRLNGEIVPVGWYKFAKPFTFFYSTATLIEVPDSLSLHNLRATIQNGITWSGPGDTILVKPGIYYENLRFNRERVVLASRFVRTDSISTVYNTIIDGDSLTRGADRGSVVYFTSDADSNSALVGFTIRNGRGTKIMEGIEEKVDGGGIFCAPGSTPTISHNVITQNHAQDNGGGIFVYSAAPNIFENIITENSAGGSGGAIRCYYSIRITPSGGLSPPEGAGEGDDETRLPYNSTPPPAESNSKTGGEDLRNSLYPKDATEVTPALPLETFAKASPNANNSPVAVVDYYPKKSKYFVGDTIWLDGSGSYDPDSLEGDSIAGYSWSGKRFYDCQTGRSRTANPNPTNQETTQYVVTNANGGLCVFSLLVFDTYGFPSAAASTPSLNVQNPPTADAGTDLVVAPGDTVWLDGSASCDINPDDDTTLSFLWTWLSGPESLTILHPDSEKASFIPEESHLGVHYFQLKVSDADTFSLDTIKVTVDHFPVPVTLDSIAGFTVNDSIPLDASKSFDPDSASDDSIKFYIWKGISRINCSDTVKSFNMSFINPDSTKKIQRFRANQGGGVYRVALYVRDTYGARSKTPDTLVVSVQLRPTANAGPDTIVRRSSAVYLHGSACEMNWDQRDSLKYEWFQNKPPNPGIITFVPNTTSKNVQFQAPKDSLLCGRYRFALRVSDPYITSAVDDTVQVFVNAFPRIDSIAPDPIRGTKFVEGDSIDLKVWAHDPDTVSGGKNLSFAWTAISWPNAPENTYKPTIINSNKSFAKFIPLKTGGYQFQIVVHDTISPKQSPSTAKDTNLVVFTVTVDTTLAYPIIMGNLISFNTAGLRGAGVDCFQSSPKVLNNIFYKNKSGSSGGAICLQTSLKSTSAERSAPYIQRNIFFGNISGDSTGGAIADVTAQLSPSATIGYRPKAVITTNDFWNNAGKDLYQPSADTSKNIYKYPRLIDPEFGDFRLECSSPCIKDSIGLLLWLYPDTCDIVPTPDTISLSLFQNPVATAVANFVVNTNVALKAPPVAYVTIGENSPAPVYFTNISSTTYRGNFVFYTSGSAHVSVFVSSVQEVPDTLIKDFSVQLIGADKMGKLLSHDSRVSVLFPQGTVKEEIYATCIPVSDDPQYDFEDEDKVALGEAYQLGPLSDFKKELTLSFPLAGYDLTEKDKTLFSIYRYEETGWRKQASFMDENSICAQVKKLGVYRLVYDSKQEHISGIPKTYQLSQNYPNPFNPQTLIKYDLPEPGHVNIAVYNILGQKVKTLVDEQQEMGYKFVYWDGKDEEGKEVASGIYFYKIKTKGFEKTKKMVLLK